MVKHADPAVLARILLQEHPQIHGTPQQQRIEASPSRVGDIQQGNFPSRGSLQFDIPQGRRHQSPSYAERDFSSQPREGIIINSRPDKSSHKPRQKISKGNEIRPPSATRRKAMGRSLVLEEVNPLCLFMELMLIDLGGHCYQSRSAPATGHKRDEAPDRSTKSQS